jgi:8-oxo-dGTP pyrophosphatase MutT (NUDIX family)
MSDFAHSYQGQLRALVGNRRLITPAAWALIRDGEGRILLTRRSDNGQWDIPAGALELGESVMDCLRREVREETGLEVVEATLIAAYTGPRFWFTNIFGGEQQRLAFVFLVTEWSGTLLTATDETTDARFFAGDHLPDLIDVHRDALDDLRQFTGEVILK